MSYRPVVGLTMRLEIETRRFYLGRDYSEALEACGATPLHIPLIPDETYIRSVLDRVDGLLLPGSDSDVDPEYYDEHPHPRLKKTVPEKDETELLVLKCAEERGIPIFAICYGMQALNVFRGGTLVQDIESQIEGSIKHEQGVPLTRNSHRIEIVEGSILHGLADGNSAKVNSHHHQAIRKTGKNLRSTAHAPDGVVECIEDERDDRFVVGVQWHPELSWKTDELSRAIFDQFVVECKRTSMGSSSFV